MKRLHYLIGLSFILLTGCSQVDSFVKKIPFIKEQKDVNQVQEGKKTKDDNIKNPEQSEQNPDQQLLLDASYFNQIEEVAGKSVIQNPTNILSLVNKQFSLPEDYSPKDLIRPNVSFSFGEQVVEKSFLREQAAAALEKMFIEAKNSGLELLAVSGYRSFDRQVVVFETEVNRVGKEKAGLLVANPGYSEHQTGLAMDISSQSASLNLTETFAETIEGSWLAENAHRFGFILRYPKGKESITGYQYEPWHFRYVGDQGAAIIFKKKITLEEYFDLVEKI